MEPVRRKLGGAHGNQLNALVWSTDGVPMLLLHGFGNEAHIWDDFAPAMAPHYRTIALDQRGHGDSDWDPEARYALEDMVADVEGVTATLGIDRLVLVGHSMGGRVSTLFAARHPERLAGLVLVDIGPDLDARGVTRIRMETEARVDPVFGSIDEYERLLSIHYPAATPEAIRRMARFGARPREGGGFVLKQDPALRGDLGGERSRMATNLEEETTRVQWEALAEIPCPTLVVRGAASDVLSPETADRMVDEVLARGTLAVVPRAGHSVMTDNPDGFLEAVSAFALSG